MTFNSEAIPARAALTLSNASDESGDLVTERLGRQIMPCPDRRITTVRVTDDLFAIRRGEDWIQDGAEWHMARSDVLRDSNRVRPLKPWRSRQRR